MPSSRPPEIDPFFTRSEPDLFLKTHGQDRDELRVDAVASHIATGTKVDDPVAELVIHVFNGSAYARLAFEVIPQDPARPEYRQGHTLGDEHKHWFRARFFQRYRLFFRFHAQAKVIVFAWVNDEDTRRACESADDAYRVFRRMLDSGRPPSHWGQLLVEARAESDRPARLAYRGTDVARTAPDPLR